MEEKRPKTIGVAVIAKNEEALIARCLSSVIGADQLVVCDTGSTDKTIEIAKEFGAEVYLDYVWNDDFSNCQNHCKSKMKTDWILSIDCDEVLITGIDSVRKAIECAINVVRVTMISEGGVKNEFGFGRLFRNTPDIFWQQKIHKHLNIPGEGEDIGNVKIMYGFSPAHHNDPDRALRILEATVAKEENPIRNLYYLGREYWYKERYQEAIDTFNRYVKVSTWAAEIADAYLIMAKCWLELKKIEECAVATLQAIKINSNFKEAIEFMEEIATKENKPQWRRMAKGATNDGVLWKRTEAEKSNDVIAIFPHNDDESLFMAFTLMRVKPLVVILTDSFIQPERGDFGCTAEIRRQETINAMAIAGCPVVFLGIKDAELTEEILRDRLKHFNPTTVYIPALQGGNAQHDIVNKVGLELFGERCEQYCTYTKTELYTKGDREIKPTTHELELKEKMLNCYESQLNLRSTLPHFLAVKGQSEWLVDKPKFLKKLLICPYFGEFPEWMDKFLENFEENLRPKGYDILIDNDLEGFKKRVKGKLGIDYPGVMGTGKPWDYRCALGVLYEDQLKDYPFFGHCDFDMVFGDVDKFCPDSLLSQLDVYSSHNEYVCGCFSLYRNTPVVNELFKQFPEWKEKMIYPEPNGWVEQQYSRAIEISGLRYKYDFQQGDPWTDTPCLKKEGNKLFQQMAYDVWQEVMFFHFRHSKRWPL